MYAIELDNISKKFTLRYDKAVHVRGEIDALKDVSLKIEKGQVFGIIGRNGAGKTTLLNIIAGIMEPSQGKIKINGKVSSLLTLGAGFQHELSARENIFLNGALLGMDDAEIRKKFYGIVQFSELEGFLDKPLQSFSQGMRMRLGFSISVHVDFDILLIDEILSVGDISFQNKSYEKIEEFRKQGKTMIVVSQCLDMIERLCDNVVLLERGEVAGTGRPQEMMKQYQKLLATKCFSEVYSDLQKFMIEREIRWWGRREDWGRRMGTKELEIKKVKIYNSKVTEDLNFRTGDDMTVDVDFIVHREIRDPHFGVAIFREDGVYCYGPNTSFDGYRFKILKKGAGSFSIKYKNLNLLPGDYRISIAIWDKKELLPYDYYCGFYKFKIIGQEDNIAFINLKYSWKSKKHFLNIFDKIKFQTGKLTNKFIGISQDDTMPRSTFLQRGFLNILNRIKSKDAGRASALSFFKPDFNFLEKWGMNFGSGEIKIKSADFIDNDGLLRNFFNSGELMQVLVELEYEKKFDSSKSHFIWFGIFRKDKVYCHGASRILLPKESDIILVYTNLDLLTGSYYLSVGIWQEEKNAIDCHHGTFPFEVHSHRKDHGTVYIDHIWRWQFDGQEEKITSC